MSPNPITTVLIGIGFAAAIAAAGAAILGRSTDLRRPSPQIQQLQQLQLPGAPPSQSVNMAGPGYGGQQFAP